MIVDLTTHLRDGLRERETEVRELKEALKLYEKEEGYFQEIEVQGSKLTYRVENLLLLELMDELTRVLAAGKSRTIINHLKSL